MTPLDSCAKTTQLSTSGKLPAFPNPTEQTSETLVLQRASMSIREAVNRWADRQVCLFRYREMNKQRKDISRLKGLWYLICLRIYKLTR